MEMKQSEVLDRWTILRIKSKYDANAKKELELYDKELTDLINGDCENARPGERPRVFTLTFMGLMCDLMEANSRIWENEAAIRNEYDRDPANNVVCGGAGQIIHAGGKPSRLQLEEIGRRSMLIREYNAKRVKAKAQIDLLFGKISDVKIDHVSSDAPKPPVRIRNEDIDDPSEGFLWDLWLKKVPDMTKKIAVIKAVREITNMGLKEAKDTVDNCPQILRHSLEREVARDLKTHLEKAGAICDLTEVSQFGNSLE